MKKLCLLFVCLFATGFANPNYQTISLKDVLPKFDASITFEQYVEIFKEIAAEMDGFYNKETFPDSKKAFYIEPGLCIDCKPSIKGDIFELTNDITYQLTTKVGLYFIINDLTLMVSEDLENWVKFEDYFTGSFQFAIKHTGVNAIEYSSKIILNKK